MKISEIKIVFAGTPKLGAIVFEELVKAGFVIKLVLTKADKPAGRGKKVIPSPVRLIAQKFKIPTLSIANLNSQEFADQLKKIAPDLIVVAAFGKILPKQVLEIPKYGVLNFHPSLLPKFRGPSPIQFAILAGEQKTGVTIIKMNENLDEGDILSQVEIVIADDDTTASLAEKLAKVGAKLLAETIKKWTAGKLTPKPQNHLKATYCGMLTKYDGKINLENPPNHEKFDRMVRAFYPWPTVWSELRINNKVLQIKFLPNKPLLIQVEGKKPVTAMEFLNGYPQAKVLLERLLFKSQVV